MVLAVFKSVMAIKILDFIFSCYSLKLMRKATWTLSCRIWEANGKFQRSSWFHRADELNGGAAFPTGLCNCPGLQTAATALLTVVSLCLIGWPTGLGWTETHQSRIQMSWRLLLKQPGLPQRLSSATADCLQVTSNWCSNSFNRNPNQVLTMYFFFFLKVNISLYPC